MHDTNLHMHDTLIQCIRGVCDDALYKLMFYLLTNECSERNMSLVGRGNSSNNKVEEDGELKC